MILCFIVKRFIKINKWWRTKKTLNRRITKRESCTNRWRHCRSPVFRYWNWRAVRVQCRQSAVDRSPVRWNSATAPTSGRRIGRGTCWDHWPGQLFQTGRTGMSPCIHCPTSRVENHVTLTNTSSNRLYRLPLKITGNVNSKTFKWS